MDGTHTQLDENNATIFILIRVSIRVSTIRGYFRRRCNVSEYLQAG